MDLELCEFDKKSLYFQPDINKGSVIMFIGNRDKGKYLLVDDFIYNKPTPLTIISGTEYGNTFYSKKFPKLTIYNELDSSLLKNCLNCEISNEKQYDGNDNHDLRKLIILDDCLYDNSWSRDETIRTLFSNSSVRLFITMQYPLDTPPDLRINIDYIVILRNNYKEHKKRIYENYATMFQSFEHFCQVMDKYTEDYGCLIINNNSKSNELKDKIFWYKATQQ